MVRSLFILFRQYGIFHRPRHLESRIIPAVGAFIPGAVIVRAFVMEVGDLAGDYKAMGQTGSDPELPLVFLGQFHAVPLAERGRITANIHRHVKDAAQRDGNQLALRPGFLEVQAAQHAIGRAGMVVLHEGQVDTDLGIAFLLPGLHEIAACIAPDFGFDEQYTFNMSPHYFHCPIPVSTSSRRY